MGIDAWSKNTKVRRWSELQQVGMRMGGGGHNVDDDKDEHTERQGKTKHI